MSATDAHHEHEKLDAYSETILELEGADIRIDLRRPLGDRERRALASLGLARPFAVLTAENPRVRNAEDAPSRAEEERREQRNERRMSALERAIEEAGIDYRRVDGVSPDGRYRESCVAVLLPRDDAVRLASRLEQLALFWYDGRDFWLLPAEADGVPRRLPEPDEGTA